VDKSLAEVEMAYGRSDIMYRTFTISKRFMKWD